MRDWYASTDISTGRTDCDRWAKDIANNKWTWYPCGVACGAGELVEQGSDLTGSTWTTSAQYLRAGGGCNSMLIRRKSSTDDEYHHEDPLGNFGVITGANAATLSSNVYGTYSVLAYAEGTRETAFAARCNRVTSYEQLMQVGNNFYFAPRSLSLVPRDSLPLAATCGLVLACLGACMLAFKGNYNFCANFCLDISRAGCSAGWAICLRLPEPQSDTCVELLLKVGCP